MNSQENENEGYELPVMCSHVTEMRPCPQYETIRTNSTQSGEYDYIDNAYDTVAAQNNEIVSKGQQSVTETFGIPQIPEYENLKTQNKYDHVDEGFIAEETSFEICNQPKRVPAGINMSDVETGFEPQSGQYQYINENYITPGISQTDGNTISQETQNETAQLF